MANRTLFPNDKPSLLLFDRRGLNRQQAIDYLGVKGTFFDKVIRPNLRGIRMGTSMIFDRQDLDIAFDQLKLTSAGDVGPTWKGTQGWQKEPLALLKQKTDAGESTRPTKDIDFRDVLKRIKQRKTG